MSTKPHQAPRMLRKSAQAPKRDNAKPPTPAELFDRVVQRQAEEVRAERERTQGNGESC